MTGDTGFKGSWLCEWLIAEGTEVFGIGLSPNTDPSLFELLNLEDRISHAELDIRNSGTVRDHLQNVAPDIVIHMATQPLVRLLRATCGNIRNQFNGYNTCFGCYQEVFKSD